MTAVYPQDAACGSLDSATADRLFFPDQPGRPTADGRLLCRQCPVRDDCLVGALERGDVYGIFGGLTAAQRHALAGAA